MNTSISPSSIHTAISRRAGWCGALLALVTLAACDTPSKLNDPSSLAPVESRSTGAAGASAGGGANTAATKPQSAVPTVDLNAGAAAAGTAAMSATGQRVVYFDFDSFAIRDDGKSIIDNHAKLLANNRSKKMVVEGHTDQRGGREYNLALGQKRAAAVVNSLTLLGATEGQLEAVSFGQERPAATGNDESAWAKNRRAELRDR
jgi:peptidoglycan-associated lipoprotein